MKDESTFKSFISANRVMPEVSTIRLDAYGSYVWGQIDGKRDVQGLSCVMIERFGQKQKGGPAPKHCCREA